MIDADLVDICQGLGKTPHPPFVAVSRHLFVIVERIAPKLSVGAEIVGRYAGNGGGPAVFSKLKKLLMRPTVGTVMGDEHGHIT